MPRVTIHTGDPNAAVVTGPTRHETQEMSSSQPGALLKIWRDDKGITAGVFRGITDPRVTGFVSYNTHGEACYTYPNAAGNGTITTKVHP